MEAIVLAGGLGTRLRTVVADLPKPMAPVRGKPFLEHLLGWMEGGGVDRAVLSVGYRWEVVRDHFGDRSGGVELSYCVEEEPLGTGGAVAKAIAQTEERTVLVVNGDTFFPVDLRALRDLQGSRGEGATLALKWMTDFDRYGTVSLDGEGIEAFREKARCPGGLVNGGVYAMERDFLRGRGLPERFSLERDVLEREAGGGRLFGAVFDVPFLDIGIPEDYARAEEFL